MIRLLAFVRDRVDEVLHPYRRGRALRRLKSMRVTSVLFICLGNICRSPYAERLLAQKRGNGSLRVHSAGFIGPGRQPPHEALQVARARGIEHSEHISRMLTPDVLEAADVLFVFDRHNARRLRGTTGAKADRIVWLGDFDPQWAGKRAIADPWGKPIEEFERTFERIERCIDEVVHALGTHSSLR